MGHGNKRWAQAAVPAFLDRILTAASRSNGFKYSKPGRWMKYRPGRTVNEIPSTPHLLARALVLAAPSRLASPAPATPQEPPLMSYLRPPATPPLLNVRLHLSHRAPRRPPTSSRAVVPAASAAGHPGRHRPTPSRAPPPPAAPPRRGVPAPRDLGPSSAAGRLDLELGGPQRCNADRVRGLLQKPMAPSGSRLLPLR